MANAFPNSGVTWLIHQLCWLLDAQQGGRELRRNLKWKPKAARRYEIHKGHCRAHEVPGYVDYLVLTVRNPLDIIVSKYYYNGGVGDMQCRIDAVCFWWATWHETYAKYDAHAKLIHTSYEGMIENPHANLQHIYKEITNAPAPEALINQVIEENTLLKLRERTKDPQGKLFRKGIIGDYKNRLSQAQINQVYDKLGDMMVMAGYEVG